MSNIGRVLYGYCDGKFYTYRDKRIEAEGYDWIVVRDSHEEPDFLSFDSEEDKIASIKKWSVEEVE
jgi:hypothetical protein